MRMAEEEEQGQQPIPETGAVFTFGRSRFAENIQNRFWIRNDPITQAACGLEHTLLLTRSGRVFSFGSNDWGQLGHGNLKVYTKPTSIKALKGNPAILVACGSNHSIVALEDRRVLSFGQNSDGQIGIGDLEQRSIPCELEELAGLEIIQASAGANHSAALTGDGRLFLWGSNTEGQLGLPSVKEETTRPTLLQFPQKISHISCGYYHTAFVTASGDLFTFGEGECGKLGYRAGQNGNVMVPSPVDGILGEVKTVACGGKHTIALTLSGIVYAFGDGSQGQLGLGMGIEGTTQPMIVDELNQSKIIHISCGENHSAVITDQKEVYMFGNDQYGKLALSSDSVNISSNKSYIPHKIEKFSNFDVTQVYCGGCHTIVLAKPKYTYATGSSTEAANMSKMHCTMARQTSYNEKRGIAGKDGESMSSKGQGKMLPIPRKDGGKSMTLLTARARRRISSFSTTEPTSSKDRSTIFAERAISIPAEVHGSLSRNSVCKNTVGQDGDLLKKYEKPSDNADTSDVESSCAGPHPSKRRTSHTELLHREINRSLSVFKGTLPHEDEDPAISIRCASPPSFKEADMGINGQNGSSVSMRPAPIPSPLPVSVSDAAQKYADDAGGSTTSGQHENATGIRTDQSDGDFEGFQYVPVEDSTAGDGENELENMEEIVKMEHAKQLAKMNGNKETKKAFTEETTAATLKHKGPLRRLSGLISKLKQETGKTPLEKNELVNGKHPAGITGKEKITGQKQSRMCRIL